MRLSPSAAEPQWEGAAEPKAPVAALTAKIERMWQNVPSKHGADYVEVAASACLGR